MWTSFPDGGPPSVLRVVGWRFVGLDASPVLRLVEFQDFRKMKLLPRGVVGERSFCQSQLVGRRGISTYTGYSYPSGRLESGAELCVCAE